MEKVERIWGYYRVLYENETVKVKELVVKPQFSLSMQKHKWRSEHWHVVTGMCDVHSNTDGGYPIPPRTLYVNNTITINKGEWHQLSNPYNSECVIIETQYGALCSEEDIERIPDSGGQIEGKVTYV